MRSNSISRVNPWLLTFWMLMVFWSGHLIFRAHNELNGHQTIQGLHRTYSTPYEIKNGWVIDPRMTSLNQELARRYLPGRVQISFTGDWSSDLSELQLSPRLFRVGETLIKPTLLFRHQVDQPDLWIREFREKQVIFRPSVGVLLLDNLPVYQRGIALMSAKDRPW